MYETCKAMYTMDLKTMSENNMIFTVYLIISGLMLVILGNYIFQYFVFQNFPRRVFPLNIQLVGPDGTSYRMGPPSEF